MKEIADRLYGGHRNFLFKLRYGIDIAEIERLVGQQHGTCAVCLEKPPKHVDHDHGSGKVRGILCFSCNRGLGKFDDDPAVIAQALYYLKGTASSAAEASQR
jgi:hypothetical protein